MAKYKWKQKRNSERVVEDRLSKDMLDYASSFDVIEMYNRVMESSLQAGLQAGTMLMHPDTYNSFINTARGDRLRGLSADFAMIDEAS